MGDDGGDRDPEIHSSYIWKIKREEEETFTKHSSNWESIKKGKLENWNNYKKKTKLHFPRRRSQTSERWYELGYHKQR